MHLAGMWLMWLDNSYVAKWTYGLWDTVACVGHVRGTYFLCRVGTLASGCMQSEDDLTSRIATSTVCRPYGNWLAAMAMAAKQVLHS
jgi:hypothetical protein